MRQAGLAGASLESITLAVATIASMNTQIASAAKEQGVVAAEISPNVVNIRDAAEQTAIDACSATSNSEELRQLAARLSQRLHQFKL